MTRGAILALLVLAGCSTAPTEREIIAAHELVGFDWCSPAQRSQCANIRHGSDMILLPQFGSYGDETRNWWNTYAVPVKAFSDD